VRNIIPAAIVACLTIAPACMAPVGASNDEVASLTSSTNTTIPIGVTSTTTKPVKHNAIGVTQIEINAPTNYVWQVLTNFDKYPNMFKNVKSCKVTKRDGNLVFTNSHLKSHWFFYDSDQQAVNDLGDAPNTLTWHTVGGSFSSLDGKWELKPCAKGNRCMATYTLALDGAPGVPTPLLSFVLHTMQKEIVGSLKKTVETDYQQRRNI